MHLEIKTVNGAIIKTEPLVMDFDEEINELWAIDSGGKEPLALADIDSIRMFSRVTYNRWMGTENEEEVLTVSDDPYRKITRTWYGRVFKFSFEGQQSQTLTWWMIIVGLLIAAASLSYFSVHRMDSKIRDTDDSDPITEPDPEPKPETTPKMDM